MKSARDLRELRASTVAEAKAVMVEAETNDDQRPTEDQQAKFDGLMSRADQLVDDIAARDRLEAAEATLAEPANSDPDPKPDRSGQPGAPENTDAGNPRGPRISTPARKLRAFTGPQAEEMAHATGMWFKAQNARCGDFDYARTWCREHGYERRAMTEGTNTAGGYLVPDVTAATIIDLQAEFGVARRLATVYPMASETLRIPKRDSGPTAAWIGETASFTASTPAMDAVNLTAKKLGTLVRVSTELFEDSAINLGDFLAADSAAALSEAEDDAMINGTGTSSFGHIYGIVPQLDANESLAGVYTAATNNDTFVEVATPDLAGVMAVMPEYGYRGAGPVFLCSSAARQAIFGRLGSSAGGTDIVSISGGLADRYGGYPIVISDKMPKGVGTDYSEKTMVVFGNFAQGVAFGDRRAITAQTLVELYAASGEIGILVSNRVDISVHEIGSTSLPGSICGLMGD